MDAGRRRAEPAGGAGDVLDVHIVPLEMYDSARAKIDANFRWLFAKAYGKDHIPEDLQDPFYTDQYEQEHIKPPVIRLLLSGELYCRVCGLILKAEQASSLHSHQAVVQALSRKGFYVLQSDNTPVSDEDLASAPIKMSSHIPLIDALMMAFTAEMMSIERVVSSVKRFSNFSASKELPFDLEDAMVFWINKVNMKMREITDKEMKMKHQLMGSPVPIHHKSPSKWYWKLVPVRYRRDHLSGRTLHHFTLVDDLMKDVCDGAALLAVVHFYCPAIVRLEDICLKEVPSIMDCLYNIQLLREFSSEYLNKSCYLKPEDMLYSPPVLKNNLMVFIAELFWWFEIVKPDFVQPRDLQEITDVRSLLQPKSSSRPHLPISNATKRSFLPSSSSADIPTISSPELSHKMTTSLSHSLLPRRQSQHMMQEDDNTGLYRSNSLTHVDGQPHQGSLLIRAERRQRPLSQPVPCGLYLSLEGSGDGDSLSLTRSMSKDSLASNFLSLTPRHMMLGPHLPPACRPNGQGLTMANIRIEDEEEELEEEELVAIIHPAALSPRQGLEPYQDGEVEQDELDDVYNGSASASKSLSARRSPCLDVHLARGAAAPRPQADAFYLEPLMPAVPKPAKEKRITPNKEEESGESSRGPRRAYADAYNSNPRRCPPATDSNSVKASSDVLKGHFTPIAKAESTLRPPAEGAVGPSQSVFKLPPPGFFLHVSREDVSQSPVETAAAAHPGQVCHGHIPTAWQGGNDSDSEIADLEDEEEDVEDMEFLEEREGEVESVKLKEDMKVCERDDKEGGSGRSSPCLSTASWASSCSASGSTSVRMTSFAERKLHKLSFRDGGSSSTSCSQKTTPDGSESVLHLLGGSLKSDSVLAGWQAKESGGVFGKAGVTGHPAVPSELLQLHMQLEEQRRAIEHQKKKTEALSARQRQKLGKAAFLNIVKKGGGKCDTLPQPLKHSPDLVVAANETKAPPCKDDSWLDELRLQGKAGRMRSGGQAGRNKRLKADATFQDDGEAGEPDLNNCNRSIEVLNDAISSIQQQIMQLSIQQDQMMKQSLTSPSGPPQPIPPASQLVSTPPLASGPAPAEPPPAPPSSTKCTPAPRAAAHFLDLGGDGCAPARRPPKLSSGQRSPRTKPSQLRVAQENSRVLSSKPGVSSDCKPPARGGVGADGPGTDANASLELNTKSAVHDDPDQRGSRKGSRRSPDPARFQDPPVGVFSGDSLHSAGATEPTENYLSGSGKEVVVGDEEESTRAKAQLIEVDLKDATEERLPDCSADGEQKNGLGFFFKDEMKMAEDEMEKRRAAFILKQQRKAEEARIRKQQQEAESELKRDEARRKAEEDRIRKEEEKARRELIKQEYLRRKQQELLEEQGLAPPQPRPQPRPRPRPKSRKGRPKSLHRGDSSSLSKGSVTRHSLMASMLIKAQGSAAGCRGADLSRSYQGSTLSLATEADSVTSGGADSNRAGSVCSVESFPMLSRASSRNLERDCWENLSSASSLTLAAEYNGPKLFKEPSSKSNKLIIINAIAHCCLAGKVNEAQKTTILEELEKCESNHLMILFRDGGCQFRAVYACSADGEEIVKFTGTGPRAISHGMIEKLYKYSSGRKQFTVIPTKTVSVSVDAMTIHNHLWQVKRPGSARRKVKHHDPGSLLPC